MEIPETSIINDFKFSTTIQVRYAETDAQGIVYNGAYFTYLEVARFEYICNLGFSKAEAVEFWERLAVVEVTCTYKSPAVFPDVLKIYARVTKLGSSSFVIEYQIHELDSLRLVTLARTVLVFIETETGRACAIPDKFRQFVMDFEGKNFGNQEGVNN